MFGFLLRFVDYVFENINIYNGFDSFSDPKEIRPVKLSMYVSCSWSNSMNLLYLYFNVKKYYLRTCIMKLTLKAIEMIWYQSATIYDIIILNF